jgi:hypothetical protein
LEFLEEVGGGVEFVGETAACLEIEGGEVGGWCGFGIFGGFVG